MVYANFSSNLPSGLQHFELVDLTNIFQEPVSDGGFLMLRNMASRT